MGRKRRRRSTSWFSILVLIALAYWFTRQSPTESDRLRKDSRPSEHESAEAGREKADREMNVHPSFTGDRAASAPDDFEEAKQRLRKLFARGSDFYCACSYNLERRPNVDPSSCGLRSRADRAKRIEWEHVVPASAFGRRFAEWRQGHPSCKGRNAKGRNCARQASATFREMEADMYNLQAAVGELNRVRGNFAFDEIPGEPREFGACDFEVFADKVEPRAAIRGDIARIYFYMDARYPGFEIINDANRKILEDWDLADPLDAAERERIQKIQDVQGNSFYTGRLSARDKSPATIAK